MSGHSGCSVLARTSRLLPSRRSRSTSASTRRLTSRWATAGSTPARRAISEIVSSVVGSSSVSASTAPCASERRKGVSMDGPAFTKHDNTFSLCDKRGRPRSCHPVEAVPPAGGRPPSVGLSVPLLDHGRRWWERLRRPPARLGASVLAFKMPARCRHLPRHRAQAPAGRPGYRGRR